MQPKVQDETVVKEKRQNQEARQEAKQVAESRNGLTAKGVTKNNTSVWGALHLVRIGIHTMAAPGPGGDKELGRVLAFVPKLRTSWKFLGFPLSAPYCRQDAGFILGLILHGVRKMNATEESHPSIHHVIYHPSPHSDQKQLFTEKLN